MQRVWCVAAVLVLAAGCGPGGPELPVNGIVIMDGVPLEGAAVTFYPEDKAGGTGGSARTGTDGKFVLLGPKGQKGLAAGQYRVTVSKLKGGGAVTDEPVVAAITEAEMAEDLPPHYSNPAQTTLAYSVTGDGKPIEIQLSSGRRK